MPQTLCAIARQERAIVALKKGIKMYGYEEEQAAEAEMAAQAEYEASLDAQGQAEAEAEAEQAKEIQCSNCKSWGLKKYEWHGNRPCDSREGFFIGGGDNNDGIYTAPDFYCKDFKSAIPGAAGNCSAEDGSPNKRMSAIDESNIVESSTASC